MIQHKFHPSANVVEARSKGLLGAEDFEELGSILQSSYVSCSRGGLLAEFPEFPIWQNLEALTRSLDFICAHENRLRRIAVVSDDEAFKFVLARVIAPLISGEMRLFGKHERKRAHQWLCDHTMVCDGAQTPLSFRYSSTLPEEVPEKDVCIEV